MQGLFNFKPSVRPVPLECHIQGYPGKFYCPRMATMNKPAYAAIQLHSPLKPVRPNAHRYLEQHASCASNRKPVTPSCSDSRV